MFRSKSRRFLPWTALSEASKGAGLPDERTRISAVLSGDHSIWTPPPARPAATVALLRDADEGLAVYLIQRASTMNFPEVTAYPGGGFATQDGHPGTQHTAARAALRELEEETAVDLGDVGALVPFARWVTPEVLPVRFDTHFFAAALPAGQEPRLVGTEAVRAAWWSPGEVLRRHAELGLVLLPPTLATLGQLARFDSVESALRGIRPSDIPRLLPRPVRAGDGFAWEVVDLDSGAVMARGDTLSSL